MSPQARWVPFTAKQFVDGTRSSFRWDARLNPTKIVSSVVTDAYEEGHGRLVVNLGGVLPVLNITGPEADQGELQRYFSSLLLCPPLLLNHPSLDWAVVGPSTLRVRDCQDPTGAIVDFDLREDGRPLTCRADRPRRVGKKAVLTPWSGAAREFQEWEGLRVASQLEVAWHLPEGPFVCYRSEVTSFVAVR